MSALAWRATGLAVALCLAFFATASAAAADTVSTLRGDALQYAAEGDRLFGYLATAPTEADARAVENEIWLHWMQAPDQAAADLMNLALERRRAYDSEAAEAILDRLIADTPIWAEAWNQRATVRFERGNLEGSLADIDETLAREPKHFGALAGRALIATQQGRIAIGQAALREAVAINPFLRERAMLVEEPGEDL